ncbi:MAG: glucosaminidase domain-containing protein [Chitinophagaceae bacterium]
MQAKIILFFLLIGTTAVKAQRADDIVLYINTYKQIAIEEEQRAGVPAAIKLAQGIHETQAGTSELVKKSNNHFGIKCKNTWAGDKVYHDDDARGECFRSYRQPEQSYRDHSDFLKSSPRYAFLFQLDPTDYKAWANGLRQAGYATNYRYAQILVKLIEDYDLEQYTLIAMGKLSPSNEVLVSNGHSGNNSNTSSIVIQAIKPSAANSAVVKEMPEQKITLIRPAYPAGEFNINNTRVVFVKEGTALLSVAEEYHLSFAHLLDFNDLNDGDVLKTDQLVFVQRKRKKGATAFHVVQAGETLYDICQAEGIRMESLLANNLLTENMKPAPGEKLYLQAIATARPMLADEKSAIMKEAVIDTLAAPADSTTHIVQTKETLYSISRKYGVSLDQLKTLNKLDSLNLKIGQQLKITVR